MSTTGINPNPEREQEITRLVELLRNSKDESTRRKAAESLEKIDPGNPVAIRPLAKVPSDPPQPPLKRGEKTIYVRGLLKDW